MNLLPFGDLPPAAARKFVPARVDWDNWDEISVLFDQLEERAAEARDAAALEQWLLDWGELSAALDEESSKRYIAMTCHTESEEAETAFLRFVENIEPELKPRQFKLEQIFLAHPCRESLPARRYEVFDRDVSRDVELFREENIPLQTAEAKLEQQYQKLTGALTVQYQGEERTLPQMGVYLEEPDRAVRQEAWELVTNRRLQEKEQFEAIFDELLSLREQIARNAGFENYLEYAFKARGRFDYTPADCVRFHDAVERVVMPAVRELHSARRSQLGLESLRPWDTAVDPLNRPPLKPFEKVERLVAGCQSIFQKLDSELADGFTTMKDLRLLDLENRKGKAPGGYQSTLPESRLPFIFMNSVGLQRDVETLLHESGHAFHALAARGEDFYFYRHGPIEFCEVASMAMELLGIEFVSEFYGAEETKRARQTHLEGIIGFFPWMATVDAFQHWIYTHPGHSREERSQAFAGLMERFGGDVDWTGYEDARANLWHRQLHIFLHPFYYVEYGIAQLGALQIWVNSQSDKAKALADCRRALALGGSRPLPELFRTAGCTFGFDADTVRPLIARASGELAALRAGS